MTKQDLIFLGACTLMAGRLDRYDNDATIARLIEIAEKVYEASVQAAIAGQY